MMPRAKLRLVQTDDGRWWVLAGFVHAYNAGRGGYVILTLQDGDEEITEEVSALDFHAVWHNAPQYYFEATEEVQNPDRMLPGEPQGGPAPSNIPWAGHNVVYAPTEDMPQEELELAGMQGIAMREPYEDEEGGPWVNVRWAGYQFDVACHVDLLK